MTMNDKITAIRSALTALTALGFRNVTVKVENTDDYLTGVYVNGEYCGIYESVRRTFVD